jgi:hypothetical protein
VPRAVWLVLPLAVAAAWALCGNAGESPPLDEKEVVREFVRGRPMAEILHEIERREPAYDLSPEMLDELRHAGLPEALIEAMRRRAEKRAAAETTAAPIPAVALALRIRLLSRGVSVARRVDPQLAAEWELGNAPEEREFADLALYLACVQPEHVPDQWRLASPLGRDFHTMPRHHLLAFISAPSGEAAPDGERIVLDLPEVLDVVLEPGVPHDLRLGLALQVGGHYRRVTDDVRTGVLVGEGGVDLTATLRGRSVSSLRVRFVADDEDADDEVAADAP